MRRLRIAFLYLLFGAAVSVVNAMLLAVAMPVLESPPFRGVMLSPTDPRWERVRDRRMERAFKISFVTCALKDTAVAVGLAPDGLTPEWISHYSATGFPFRCLEGRWDNFSGLTVDSQRRHRGGVHVASGKSIFPLVGSQYDDFVPIVPIWAGLLGDAVFYGGLAGLLRETLLLGRRWIRRWRGRCERCAYPRGAAGVCAECGLAGKPANPAVP